MDPQRKVTIGLTPAHDRAVDLLAKKWSTSRSEVIRRSLEIAAREEALWTQAGKESQQ